MKLRFAIAGLLATMPFGAALAETYSANGKGMGTTSAEQMPVSEDLIVVHSMTSYDGFEVDDADNPLASLTGPCFGAVLIDAGAVSGGGNCHYTDADGDKVVMAWTATGMSETGRTMGEWSVVGGTGKWESAEGGGTFDAGDDAQGDYSNQIMGEITMP